MGPIILPSGKPFHNNMSPVELLSVGLSVLENTKHSLYFHTAKENCWWQALGSLSAVPDHVIEELLINLYAISPLTVFDKLTRNGKL